jgi:hypothetical protein
MPKNIEIDFKSLPNPQLPVPDELQEFRKKLAQGLPQEQYEEMKHKLIARGTGITAQDYVEMCMDFDEIRLQEGIYKFTPLISPKNS